VRREINKRDKLFFPEHTFSAEYAGRIKGEDICFWRGENGDRKWGVSRRFYICPS